MNIRPFRSDDLRQVLDIAASLPEAPHWPERVYANALDPEAVPRRIALVAEESQVGVCGFLMAVLVPPQAELETIAVARHAQRRGIATRLLTQLLSILQKCQITEVMLEVRKSNYAARYFYASAGFAEIGRRTAYYTEPTEDAILLSRVLMRAPNAPTSHDTE